jgi:hypothetical protein
MSMKRPVWRGDLLLAMAASDSDEALERMANALGFEKGEKGEKKDDDESADDGDESIEDCD